jgi:hypothetical protein
MWSKDLGAVELVSHLFQKTPPQTPLTFQDRAFQTFQPHDTLFNYLVYMFHLEKEAVKNNYTPSNTTLVTQSWFFQRPHRGRNKCIVIPDHVDTFSVHAITSGKKTVRASNMRINHYRYACDFCHGEFQYDNSMKTM